MPIKYRQKNSLLKTEIIPTILTKTLSDFLKKIEKIKPFFKKAHIDIVDPNFANNKTYSETRKIDSIAKGIDFDVHIMATDPEKYLPKLFRIKRIKRIFIHYEIKSSLERMIKAIQDSGREVGLSTKIETPISIYNDYREVIDCAHLLSVKPGFNGGEFNKAVLPKIRRLRRKYPELNIAVDGGIKNHNISSIQAAGANIFFVGSFLYEDEIEDQRDELFDILNI